MVLKQAGSSIASASSGVVRPVGEFLLSPEMTPDYVKRLNAMAPRFGV
jgi:hypothetical protein